MISKPPKIMMTTTQPSSPRGGTLTNHLETHLQMKAFKKKSFNQSGKRLSVANIPGARHNNNISPIRSSLDNLASVLLTSKNSFVNSTPVSASGRFSTKKQLVPKIVIADDPQGSAQKEDVQLVFVDRIHTDQMPSNSRKNNISSANLLNSHNQIAVTAEQLQLMQDKLTKL